MRVFPEIKDVTDVGSLLKGILSVEKIAQLGIDDPESKL